MEPVAQHMASHSSKSASPHGERHECSPSRKFERPGSRCSTITDSITTLGLSKWDAGNEEWTRWIDGRQLGSPRMNASTDRSPTSSPSSGSSSRDASRPNTCGKPGCRCHGDPPQPHGPYWHWTAKVDGKTVNRRLTDREAELYQEWIANDRHLRDVISKMREIAAKATDLLVEQDLQQA